MVTFMVLLRVFDVGIITTHAGLYTLGFCNDVFSFYSDLCDTVPGAFLRLYLNFYDYSRLLSALTWATLVDSNWF